MKEDSEVISEKERRRRRINLYKKIIVIMIVSIIVLPSILCVVLFVRMSGMNREIKSLKSIIEQESILDRTTATDEKTEPTTREDITTGPVDSETENSDQSETTEDETSQETTEEPTEEVTTEGTTEEPTSQANPNTSQKALVEQALAEGRKVVYLTFDDGPYNNTENLLDVLDRYNVKATFFVIGNKNYNNSLRRIVNDGHSLGMHTMSHDYSKVYSSVSAMAAEITELQEYLYSVTGYRSHLFRFPGGTSNARTQIPISNFIDYVNSQGIAYFDWNVSSGDGGIVNSADVVYNNVMNGINGVNGSKGVNPAVVLMHDAPGKLTTYEAVPRIIEALQAMNALILPITDDTMPVHHR